MHYLTFEGEPEMTKKKITATEISVRKKDQALKKEIRFLETMSHETKQHFLHIKGYNKIKFLLKRRETQKMIRNIFAKSILGIGDSDCTGKYALAALSRDSGMSITFPDRYSYKYFKILHKKGDAKVKTRHPKDSSIHPADMRDFLDKIKTEFEELMNDQFNRVLIQGTTTENYTVVHITPYKEI